MIESNPSKSTVISPSPQYPQCFACKTILTSVKKCTGCFIAVYCNQNCQRLHWPQHKKDCALKKIPNVENHAQSIESTQIQEWFARNNEIIRKRFIKFEGEFPDISKDYNHIAQTQEFILEGAKHLNPEKSIIVVCGAQFFNNKYVDPLPELLNKCKKLILIDIDTTTLNKLKEMLNSPKVVTVTMDLSNSYHDLILFEKEMESQNRTPSEFFDQFFSIFEKAMKDKHETMRNIEGALQKNERADYVVSSLVGSQLALELQGSVTFAFEKIFKTKADSFLTSHSNYEDKFVDYVRKGIIEITKSHLKDLFIWAGSSGCVYFSDTFSQPNYTLIDIGEIRKFLNSVKEKEKTIQERNWHWIRDKSKDDTYFVHAFLIQ